MYDLDLAIAVAEEGATIVRCRFRSAPWRLDKGAGDFVTHADVIEAENAMVAMLHRKWPEGAILGEENGRSGASSDLRTWLIDPLRATLNYAVRMRVVAVNVALRVTGRVAAAAVVDSFNDEIFWTNSVSALLHANDEDTPLAPTGKSTLVDLNFDHPYLNAPAFKALMLAADMDFATRFKHRVVSTSLALVWVASGQRTAYVTNGDLRDSLHFTAGLAICELAGCIVIVLMGNSWGSGETGFLAAVDCRPHAALLDLIR